MINHHDIEAFSDSNPDKSETVSHGKADGSGGGTGCNPPMSISESKLPLSCQSTIATMYAYYTGREIQ